MEKFKYSTKINRLLKIYDMYDALAGVSARDLEDSEIIEDEYSIYDDYTLDDAIKIGSRYAIFRGIPGDVRSSKQYEFSYVYFIENELTGHIKIGKSNNLSSRLKSLRTSNSGNLNVLGVIKTTVDKACCKECAIQERFSKYRVNGEWFLKNDELLKYISENTTTYEDK